MTEPENLTKIKSYLKDYGICYWLKEPNEEEFKELTSSVGFYLMDLPACFNIINSMARKVDKEYPVQLTYDFYHNFLTIKYHESGDDSILLKVAEATQLQQWEDQQAYQPQEEPTPYNAMSSMLEVKTLPSNTIMMISASSISTFNEVSDTETDIHLTTGEVVRALATYEEIKGFFTYFKSQEVNPVIQN